MIISISKSHIHEICALRSLSLTNGGILLRLVAFVIGPMANKMRIRERGVLLAPGCFQCCAQIGDEMFVFPPTRFLIGLAKKR